MASCNHFITEAARPRRLEPVPTRDRDADLGIQLQGLYRTAIVDSTTLEASSQVPNWIRQRSRWNKGYIEDLAGAHAAPDAAARGDRDARLLKFNLTMPRRFVLLLNPIFWGLTTLYVFTQAGFIEQLFPGIIFTVASAALHPATSSSSTSTSPAALQRGEFSLTGRH